MELAAIVEDSRKLFQLIRTAGKKALGVIKTICEADGSPVHIHQRRFVRWAEHNLAQLSWPSASAIPGSRPVASYNITTN